MPENNTPINPLSLDSPINPTLVDIDDGNFRPAPFNLLVIPAAREEKVGENKIIVAPESAQGQPQHAIVHAVGKDVCNYKVGERVLFVKYSGKPVKINNTAFLVLHENEIFGAVDTGAEVVVG